ncbi:hypothetical protein T11_7026 [Trichinella zimbabwensis]|uniref:Uncharacterized protein n=1 Tax=Trichinella zimbabwensis TaxID=268475 RepID=A0A0V1I270_9BILA|nr:hypothetical protein T11_7026 [Trichinella zimbabwensis]
MEHLPSDAATPQLVKDLLPSVDPSVTSSSSFEYVEQSIDNSQSKIFVANSELYDDADGSSVIETSVVDAYNSTITDVMYESAVEGNNDATLSMDEKDFMKTAHSEIELCITPTERSAVGDVIIAEANRVDCEEDTDSKIDKVESVTEKDDKEEEEEEEEDSEHGKGDQNLTNNNGDSADVAEVSSDVGVSDVVQQENGIDLTKKPIEPVGSSLKSGDIVEETDEVLEYEPVMVTQTLSNDAVVVDVVEPKLHENISSVDMSSNVQSDVNNADENFTEQRRIEIDNQLEKDGDVLFENTATKVEIENLTTEIEMKDASVEEDKDVSEKELNETVVEVSKTESVIQMNLEPDNTVEVEDADQSRLNQVKNESNNNESVNDSVKDATSAIEKDEELVGPVVKRGRRRKSQAQPAEKTSEPVEQMTTRSRSKAAAALASAVNTEENKSNTIVKKTLESEMQVVESKETPTVVNRIGRPSTSKRGRKPRQKDTTETTTETDKAVKSTKSKEKKPVTKSVKRKAK